MAEVALQEDILNALIENTKVIDSNTAVLSGLNEKKEGEEKTEKNVNKAPKVSSSLTGDEKTRYANIGKELFAPVLSALDKLIKREKRKSEMLIKDDADTIGDGVKVQYETKPNDEGEANGTSWLTILLGILAVAGAAIYFFKDKISDFFTSIWDWVSDMFSSIANFFSTENGASPISKVLKLCSDALSGLWKFVKPIFEKLGGFGKVIWDGISFAWHNFITGPNGILNFGTKVVSGLIDFAGNAIRWIADAIKGAIMAPIKMIFGSAEDDGKAASEEAIEDVKVSVNQAASDQAAKTKAITDETLFSAEKADQAIIETAKATRDAASAKAKKYGLEVKDGKVTDESLKEHAAKAGLDAFMKANNIESVDNDEYQKYKNEFMKFVEVKEGKADINMKALKEHMNKLADDDSSIWTNESDFIDKLQNMSPEQMNGINGTVKGALAEGLQMNADLKAAENLENMTEEEKFEARLRQAMNSGKSAEFRFMEGRKMILESAEMIKNAFIGYDNTIRSNFTSTWGSFMHDFLEQIKITINTSSPQDNSHNTYSITPLHKESFRTMANQLVALSQASLEVVTQQNILLADICHLLANPPAPAEPETPLIPDQISDAIDEAANTVASFAKNLYGELYESSSFFS